METKKKIIHFIRKLNNDLIIPFKIKDKPKIFCIGRNKTGTTSLQKAFEDLGYCVGNQLEAELLLRDYKKGEFKKIIQYCKKAQVFQDFPFSYPITYKVMDEAYPNAKFILSIRDSSEQWYNSLLKFHSKLFGDGQTPTAAQLKNADYVWKGFIWESSRLIYKTPESDPYNKALLIKSYEDYNNNVIKYFRNRSEDLLIINLAEKNSYKKLIDFLGISSPYKNFPWENKTNSI